MANKNTTEREETKIAEAREERSSYNTEDGLIGNKTASSPERTREKLEDDFSVVDRESQLPGKNTDARDQYADLMDEEEMDTQGSTQRERRDGITKDEDSDGIVMGTEADVTKEDLELLGDPDQDMDGGDDEDFNRVSLDATDEDGDPLNENAEAMSATGEDLDMPGDDAEGTDESINEDEENQYYSLGSDDNDGLNEGTP
ncbi:MAG: hypothetical protein EOO09_14205 [Chitinophagaceae bacterium]|nr:MAG: hypothetical protein EOO09_14205 [Chitinophagaceae bacterium]